MKINRDLLLCLRCYNKRNNTEHSAFDVVLNTKKICEQCGEPHVVFMEKRPTFHCRHCHGCPYRD